MKKTAFLCLLLLFFAGCRKEAEKRKNAVTVRTAPIAERVFRVAINTQGVIEADERATLSSRIAGTLEELNVKEGDRVKKGTILFRQDRQTLENRRILAAEALQMAKERLNTRTVDAEIAQLGFKKKESDYLRQKKLFEKKIVSESAFETAELSYREAKLSCTKALAAKSTAEAEVKFASSTLEIAVKQLEDSMVTAPYDLTVVAKLRELHEFCGAGTPVLKVERFPGTKKIAAAVSGLYFGSVRSGQSRAVVSYGGKTVADVPVTFTDSVIDPVSRTFLVKAELPQDLRIGSGALCELSIVLEMRRSPALPEDAVLFRKKGKFAVFVTENGRAREIPVTAGLSQGGFTEVLDGEKLRGKNVIVSGQYFVNDGAAVAERAQ